MIRYLSLFSGIGAFEKALKNIGLDYDLVGYSEIDKYASKSYSAIHNIPETMNLGDITKHNEWQLPKDIDLCTYGFPCQDISTGGKHKGIVRGQTRSGLFFEALEIIERVQPRIAIAENVKNLTGKMFTKQFKAVLDGLEKAGYNNYFRVLNARDYNIPQNRERVFIISVRKDIDKGMFNFPEKKPLQKQLKDVLETNVDKKYYIDEKKYSDLSYKKGINGITPTTPYIVASRGRNPNNSSDRTVGVHTEQRLEPNCRGIANTLSTVLKDNYVCEPANGFKVRTLTAKEYFRLMGFTDNDYNAVQRVTPATQIYKQAGNSIPVPVLEAIFEELKKIM